jgi:hypothetical protein
VAACAENWDSEELNPFYEKFIFRANCGFAEKVFRAKQFLFRAEKYIYRCLFIRLQLLYFPYFIAYNSIKSADFRI